MKKKYLLFLLTFCLFKTISFAQNGQEPDQIKRQSIEDVFIKENGNKARVILNKEKYLVVENLRNGKSFRYYIGDAMAFKTIDNFNFNDQINAVTDSTFQIAAFNESTNRRELFTVKVKDVTAVYTAPKKPFFPLTALAAPVFFGIDWAYYKEFPKDRLPLFIALEALPIGWNAIANIKRVKNVKKTYQLKAFQAY